MKLSKEHHDSDSTHSPIHDNEKVVGVEQGAFETRGRGQPPPDPDAGLSEEEKAHIVCCHISNHVAQVLISTSRIANSSGNSISA